MMKVISTRQNHTRLGNGCLLGGRHALGVHVRNGLHPPLELFTLFLRGRHTKVVRVHELRNHLFIPE